MEPDASNAWTTSQLVEYLGALSEGSDQTTACRAAIERMLESLDAEVGIIFGPLTEPVVVGLPADDDRVLMLTAAARDGSPAVRVAGLGQLHLGVVALDVGEDAMRLLVARAGPDGIAADEMLLLRGMAWVLDLALRPVQLMGELNERQYALDQVDRIQRLIIDRVPLPEIFDAATESALGLAGVELATLYLVDRDIPASRDELISVSVSAVSDDRRPPPWLLRVRSGAVWEAYQRKEPIRVDDYATIPSALPGMIEAGAAAAMAVPIREDGVVVGGLGVTTFKPRYKFSKAQEHALVTFADQVSVALSNAKSYATAQTALHDPVTGLPNRRAFLERLERALAGGSQVSVLFLDLDRFKLVNDTMGHAAGDNLLRQIGDRLRKRLHGEGYLARFGGDEYVVLMENSSDSAVGHIGRQMLDAVQEAYRIGSEKVVVGGSIGVAGGAGYAMASEILRDADTAMYRAKHAGGNRIMVFEQRMHTALVRRRSMEADLRQAVDGNALHVVYQPIVDLQHRHVHAAEALVRWDHSSGTAVPPADFIPLAEENGLIIPIGRQVLAAACAQAQTWPLVSPDGHQPSVSVNLPARQLLDPSFVPDLRHILADTNLDPGRLILEITESAIVHDIDTALERMHGLREIGVRLAIDDFGTGYSSLSYLRMFPADILKIDKSFIDNVAAGWQGLAFVRAIVRLATALSMTTVAEGIETEDQVAAILGAGGELGQGYLFAKPSRAADFASYLETSMSTARSVPTPYLAGQDRDRLSGSAPD